MKPTAMALAAVLVGAPYYASNDELSRWVGWEDSDDLRGTVVTVASGDRGGPDPGKRFIIVRCNGRGGLEMYVGFKYTYFGSDARPVAYRFDSGDIENDTWSTSSRGTAVFADESDVPELARQLMSGERFVIEITAYDGAAYQETFPLTGSAGPVGKVLDACDVPRP